VLQEDDGWEELEEAWELGEAEGMIVGAVCQGEGYSWQDACEAWEAQDGEMKASIHQVRADGVGKGVPGEANVDEQSEAEADGLLVEGDEREYILELLLREVPPDAEAGVHPARAELATLTGKRKRNHGKKLCKKLKMARSAAIKESKKEGKRGQTATALTRKPGAKGRGPDDKKRGDRGLSTAPTPTSGGECSE
jgi:hypothetical protein